MGVSDRGTGGRRPQPADPSPSPSVATSGAPVPLLLQAYDDVIQAALDLPPVVVVPYTHRRRGLWRFFHALPRPRWRLHAAIVRHVEGTLDLIRRRLLAAAALGRAPEPHLADPLAVEQYLQSLPTRDWKVRFTTLLVIGVVVTRFVLVHLPGVTRSLGGDAVSKQHEVIERMLDAIGRLSSDLSSLDSLLLAVPEAHLDVILFLATALATILYLELRIFVPSFRLKRMLFNLYPQLKGLTTTTSGWGVQQSTGLYELERSALRRVGARTKHEFPWDLVVPALLMPSLLYLGGLMIHAGFAQPVRGDPLMSLISGGAIIGVALARLAWLARAGWRRRSESREPYIPCETRIRDTQLVVKLRDPATVLLATGLAGAAWFGVGLAHPDGPLQGLHVARFFTFLVVIAPVWYRMNRELCEFVRARGGARAGWPVLSLLAMASGGLFRSGMSLVPTAWVLASVYGTCRRIQRAESIAGEADSGLRPLWLLVPGFVFFPAVVAHLQGALNTIWSRQGHALDPS